MKTKSLMTMLLGGAMLAACTADDALTPAPVAQEVNPSAPVFNVTFEDDDLQLRGELNSSNGMVWKDGDLMSLFHGVQTVSTFTGWQNAIYEAEGGDEGQLTFLTNAMVQPGYALMVYPADLGFDQMQNGLGKAEPVISLPDVQDVETKGNTPYISEILTLAAEPTNGEAEAGYRKEYDIVMRRAASTLIVNLTATKDAPAIKNVDPFEIKSVELTGKFTKSIKVKAATSPREDEAKPYWAYNSVMEMATEADNIVTTDIKDNKVVTFTLLNKNQDLENSTVILHTNWGTITIGKDAKNWVGKTKVTTTDALNAMFGVLFAEDTTDGGLFEGEIKGRATTVGLEVDMSDLKMNGMHIADQAALKTALAVYEGLPSTEDVTFILDGDEKNEFVIDDEDLREKVVGYMNAKNSTIKFQACVKDNTEKCVAVKLVHAGEAIEVPNLVFNKDQKDELQGASTTLNDVQVQLVGNWKYNSSTEEVKKLTNVSELVVLGTLDLQSNTIDADGNTSIVVEKDGKVNVSNFVIVNMDLLNKGTIEIANKKSLAAGDDTTIINWWSEENDDDADDYKLTGWNQTTNETNKRCGVILNYGTLGASDSGDGTSTARIENYGVIKLENSFACAMISTNQTETASTGTAYTKPTYSGGAVSGGNVFGVIELFDKNGGGEGLTSVRAAGREGFIKLTIGKDSKGVDLDITNDNVGTIANYVIVESSTVNATAGTATAPKTLGTNGKFGYLEMVSDYVTISRDTELSGLIVSDNCTVEVPGGVTLKIGDNIYLAGALRGNGSLAGAQGKYVGYFGGNANDYTHCTVKPAQ